MRPGTLDNNNWAELGQLVIDYWKGDISEATIRADPKGELAKCGCHIPDNITVEVHFDRADHIHIVFPYCPWDSKGFPSHTSELDFVESIEAYRRELGIVVMGGCR